jgi:hypothetical protein
MDLMASALAFRFIASLVYFVDDPIPEPPAALSAVSEVLTDRIGKLRDMLASGKIVAFGTFVQTGIEGPIARLQWARDDVSVEISNGDFCEGSDHRAVPRWTGLSLRLPNEMVPTREPKISAVPELTERLRPAKTQIQTKAKCRLECVAWLEDMMRASPGVGEFSKEELWRRTKAKWPEKLSRRKFEEARTEAINKTEAWAWSEPGPKRKSPHS